MTLVILVDAGVGLLTMTSVILPIVDVELVTDLSFILSGGVIRVCVVDFDLFHCPRGKLGRSHDPCRVNYHDHDDHDHDDHDHYH
jgi:hypothetical protein